MAGCLGAAALTFAPFARGDDEARLVAGNKPDRVWYGWQTLLFDAGALATLAPLPAYVATNASAVLVPLAGAIFLSAPIAHALHHRWNAVGNSLAVRLLVTASTSVIGLGIGANLTGCSGNFCQAPTPSNLEGLYTGALIGMVVSSAFDATFLAWEKRAIIRTTVSWSIIPSITPHGRRWRLPSQTSGAEREQRRRCDRQDGQDEGGEAGCVPMHGSGS